MDIILILALVFTFFILFSICGWCCKRHREGTVYGFAGGPVTISTQPVNASPVVVPPYPIDARHPTPQMTTQQAPAPGFMSTNAPYPTNTAYPPNTAPGYYYPPHPGVYQGPVVTPYPPTTPYPPGVGIQGQAAPPPSYHEAMGQPLPPQAQHTTEMYAKQAPYNPHYQ